MAGPGDGQVEARPIEDPFDKCQSFECWGYQRPHKSGKFGRDGIPHEKTDVMVVLRLKKILHPAEDAAAIQRSHEADQSVARDVTGRPHLEDYGRYGTLMGSLQPLHSAKCRYPQLVSFIGVTNAGKSTIIKMLVNHTKSGRSEGKQYPTPVVGSVTNDKVSTSGDIHLYADGSTIADQLPILYADCEGFEGGEKTPLGAWSRRRPVPDAYPVQPEYAQARSFPIQWASSEESRQREYAVRELYPHLLYTFSDAVVFVLRNPKTFQSSVLTKLLEWGAAALEKSLNQPSLPHAIVLLNDTEPGVDEKEWETEYVTKTLLSSVSGALDYLEGVPRFRELANYWRGLGKYIGCVEDLILRYYSSFKSNCDASFKAKRKARVLTNPEELNVYLQSAFEHFTRTLASPFNFVAVSLLKNPISLDFGGHMLQLISTIAAQEPARSRKDDGSSWIFEKMCAMVASYIMLDCARYRKGRIEDLFVSYKKFFGWTLREYCDMWLPCSFTDTDGRRCALIKARHNTKGHQDEQGIIASGEYQSGFDAESYGPIWERQLKRAINVVQRTFQYEQDQVAQQDQPVSDDKIALRIHRAHASEFYVDVGDADKIVSHASCFCCLMDVPEHPLPCGHVLCTGCIHTFGKKVGKCVVEMSYCPLHRDTTSWMQPHLIKFRHKAAGTRVLCLDGGGIRGIVELEVLRAIEEALGGEIPVQDFFDLIVGTSTGGIIALALGVQQLPVEQCIDMFTSLCDHAYTPHAEGMPLLDFAATVSHGSKYKSKDFHEALKSTFGGGEALFGSRSCSNSQPKNKVAVTSTSSTGGRAIAIANYRRKDDSQPDYDFERAHEPELEMRVWEAAAATSATPTYFKPFVSPLTRRMYLDGALHNNNPARVANRERRLIWPEATDADPDILLSLRTGQNRISILPKLSAKTTDRTTSPSALHKTSNEKPRGVSRLLKPWSALHNRADDILDAEVAWAEFRNDVVGVDRSQQNSQRYIRFNPDLGKRVPSMDDKGDLRSLQMTVRKRLSLPHCVSAVELVAHRLIASSFILDTRGRASHPGGAQQFQRSVLCKFENGSTNLRALGRFFARHTTADFVPYTRVRSEYPGIKDTICEVSPGVVRAMIDEAGVRMQDLIITVADEPVASNFTMVLFPHDGLEPDGFALSGMSKVLANELSSNPTSRSRKKSSSPISYSDSVPQPNRISLNGEPLRQTGWAPTRGPLAGYKPVERGATAPKVHARPIATRIQSLTGIANAQIASGRT